MDPCLSKREDFEAGFSAVDEFLVIPAPRKRLADAFLPALVSIKLTRN
jgi:hypothetical protein